MDYGQFAHILANNSPTLAAILIAWLANNSRLKVLETKLDNTNLRLDRVESRLDRIESRLDKLDERVRSLELFNAGTTKLLSQ